MHYISPFSPATSIRPWPDVSWSGTKSKLVSNHRSLQIQWSYCKPCVTSDVASAFVCFTQSFAGGSRKTKNKEGKKRKEERKERRGERKKERTNKRIKGEEIRCCFSNALPTCFSCYATWKHSLWNLNNCNTRCSPTLKLTILVKFKELQCLMLSDCEAYTRHIFIIRI